MSVVVGVRPWRWLRHGLAIERARPGLDASVDEAATPGTVGALVAVSDPYLAPPDAEVPLVSDVGRLPPPPGLDLVPLSTPPRMNIVDAAALSRRRRDVPVVLSDTDDLSCVIEIFLPFYFVLRTYLYLFMNTSSYEMRGSGH